MKRGDKNVNAIKVDIEISEISNIRAITTVVAEVCAINFHICISFMV